MTNTKNQRVYNIHAVQYHKRNLNLSNPKAVQLYKDSNIQPMHPFLPHGLVDSPGLIYKKDVWAAVPKAASNSIRGVLVRNGFRPLTTHHVYEVVSNLDDYFIFTCVRNTWDRILASYCHVINGDLAAQFLPLFGVSIPEELSFEHFCKNMLNKHCYDQHWAPYSRILPTKIDLVLRFEYLEEDWEKFTKTYPLVKRRLKHIVPHPIWEKPKNRDFYTDETIGLVGELFKEDIERFGFEYKP